MLDFFSLRFQRNIVRDDTVRGKKGNDQTNNKSPFGKNGNK